MSNLGQLFDKPGEGWATVENIEKIKNGDLTIEEAILEFNPEADLSAVSAKTINAADAVNRVGPNGYGKSLRYPQDHLQHDSDYVMFNFYRYTPPFKKDMGERTYWWEGAKTGKNALEQQAQREVSGVGRGGLDEYNKSALYSRAEVLTPIVLYMPEDISSSYKANWTGKAFSNVARDAMEAASQGGWSKVEGLSDGVNNLMKRSKALVGAQAIRTATQTITGDTLSNDDVFGGISGVILNPNAEMLFGGTEFRTLTLNYKLVPRNEGEARAIKGIIKTFKQAMLPTHNVGGADAKVFGQQVGDNNKSGQSEFVGGDDVLDLNYQKTRHWLDWFNWFGTGTAHAGGGLDNAFIAVPNLVNVAFMNGSGLNPNVPQYKMCAITNVDVNYTPDGAWATYGDGTPVATTLSLSLQETKLLFAEDVAGGAF